MTGTHDSTLTWGTASPGQNVTIVPSGTTVLTIAVTPAAGGLAYVPMQGLCGPGYITVNATVRFVSADGGFNETWQKTLLSNDGHSAIFYQDLQRTPVAGSFAVTYTGTNPGTSTQNTLTAIFNDLGASGSVQFATSETSSGGAGASSGSVIGGGGIIVKAASWVPRGDGDGGPEGDSEPDALPEGQATD